MGFLLNVVRSDFYNELTSELQKKYLSLKNKKYLPTIDNIYYSIFLSEDENGNPKLIRFLKQLEALKEQVMKTHEPQEFKNGLMVDHKSSGLYKYCLTNPDLYDIFIMSYLPNEKTSRIMVQIRSFGLWVHSAEKMLSESFEHVSAIFEQLGCKISSCRENRIDYCYHTNIITNPESILKDRNIAKHMVTTMEKWKQMGRIEDEDGLTVLKKDYFSLGDRASNNVFIRIYNKALEVIEMGYKSFFFDIWYKNGLISFYDKYCFEYAYQEGKNNYDYVHKAKLHFYLEYGTDSMVKKEFELTLKDANSTLEDYKTLAKKYMPEVTTIMNIEFETKRRFYYFSDEFIDNALKFIPREGSPQPLNRLYKIIDNRTVFLDYLTGKTVAFVDKGRTAENTSDDTAEDSKKIYVSWWKRLRNTKLEGLKTDEKLLRDYAHELDERLAKVRFINTVATNAVYADNVGSDFIDDITDLISNLNDNHTHKMNVAFYSADGEIIDGLYSELLAGYLTKKKNKEKYLKNRKKSADVSKL